MAELKGPILFTGSIGNIRAYYNTTLKRYIVSTKGGANKELIKNNPAFARQRENMKEFKVCAYWAAQLRKSLMSINHLQQGYYFSDIMSMAKSIQKHDDVHMRGFRSVESSKDAALLTGINFNKLHPFEQVLTHQWDVAFSDDKRTVTLQLMGFKSFARINWPARFDAYRIVLVIAQQPNFYWNELEQMFLPVATHLDRLSVTTYSEWHRRSTDLKDIVLSASFAQPALQIAGTVVVVALGIEVSMDYGVPSTANPVGFGSMKIVKCFTPS